MFRFAVFTQQRQGLALSRNALLSAKVNKKPLKHLSKQGDKRILPFGNGS
jgi:hypothetical protein